MNGNKPDIISQVRYSNRTVKEQSLGLEYWFSKGEPSYSEEFIVNTYRVNDNFRSTEYVIDNIYYGEDIHLLMQEHRNKQIEETKIYLEVSKDEVLI